MTESMECTGECWKDLVRELGEIHGSLQVLSNGQMEICRRLDKVNGSIATLYNRTEENKEALLNHVIDCPQKKKIEQIGAKFAVFEQKISRLHRIIGEQVAGDSASAAQSSKWMDKLLFPLIRIAVTGLVLILLYHAQELLKVLK
jgi:hypothetical protein